MNRNRYKTGRIYALSCAMIRGFLPIYWDALNPIASGVIIFYRIVLMALVCLLIVVYEKRSLKAVFAPMFESRRPVRQPIGSESSSMGLAALCLMADDRS